jgi:hypothetical protein
VAVVSDTCPFFALSISKFIEEKENENEIYFKMIRTCSPSTFLEKHCICGHKMRRWEEPQTPVLENLK